MYTVSPTGHKFWLQVIPYTEFVNTMPHCLHALYTSEKHSYDRDWCELPYDGPMNMKAKKTYWFDKRTGDAHWIKPQAALDEEMQAPDIGGYVTEMFEKVVEAEVKAAIEKEAALLAFSKAMDDTPSGGSKKRMSVAKVGGGKRMSRVQTRRRTKLGAGHGAGGRRSMLVGDGGDEGGGAEDKLAAEAATFHARASQVPLTLDRGMQVIGTLSFDLTSAQLVLVREALVTTVFKGEGILPPTPPQQERSLADGDGSASDNAAVAAAGMGDISTSAASAALAAAARGSGASSPTLFSTPASLSTTLTLASASSSSPTANGAAGSAGAADDGEGSLLAPMGSVVAVLPRLVAKVLLIQLPPYSRTNAPMH
jgi:hypothetical protein